VRARRVKDQLHLVGKQGRAVIRRPLVLNVHHIQPGRFAQQFHRQPNRAPRRAVVVLAGIGFHPRDEFRHVLCGRFGVHDHGVSRLGDLSDGRKVLLDIE